VGLVALMPMSCLSNHNRLTSTTAKLLQRYPSLAREGFPDDNTLATDNDLEYYNFDENDEMAPRLVYSNWLADTAATSHITNRRDVFITYESIPAITIRGVGGTKTRAIGRGDINL